MAIEIIIKERGWRKKKSVIVKGRESQSIKIELDRLTYLFVHI